MNFVPMPIFIPMNYGGVVDNPIQVVILAILTVYLILIPAYYLIVTTDSRKLRGRDILFGIFVLPLVLPFKGIKWFFKNF
jgi:ABC-type transport system involved in cytochrome c biogenesis permease component